MTNAFLLFGLPVQFQIDQVALSTRYLELQKELHPDNYASSSIAEQRLLRAEAIIEIETGIAKNLEEKSMRDVEFLMQQMEWHETLESIEHKKDEEALTHFLKQIKAEQKKVLIELEETLNQKNWQQANALTDRLRYFKKLIIQIEKVEEQFFEM